MSIDNKINDIREYFLMKGLSLKQKLRDFGYKAYDRFIKLFSVTRSLQYYDDEIFNIRTEDQIHYFCQNKMLTNGYQTKNEKNHDIIPSIDSGVTGNQELADTNNKPQNNQSPIVSPCLIKNTEEARRVSEESSDIDSFCSKTYQNDKNEIQNEISRKEIFISGILIILVSFYLFILDFFFIYVYICRKYYKIIIFFHVVVLTWLFFLIYVLRLFRKKLKKNILVAYGIFIVFLIVLYFFITTYLVYIMVGYGENNFSFCNILNEDNIKNNTLN